MQYVLTSKKLFVTLLCLSMTCCSPTLNVIQEPPAPNNTPTISPERTDDRVISNLRQGEAGDCFFLASLIALAHNPQGANLIHKSVKPNKNGFIVVFPNLPDISIEVTPHDLAHYLLLSKQGDRLVTPAQGSRIVHILEIAADKYWKENIKPQGLWDDVPMNALAMFSNNKQTLLLNRQAMPHSALQDIDKYNLFATDLVQQLHPQSPEAILQLLKTLTKKTPPVTVLLDYITYHAKALLPCPENDHMLNIVDPQNPDQVQRIDHKTLARSIHAGAYALVILQL